MNKVIKQNQGEFMNQKQFGQMMRRLRRDAGLTQEQVAEALGYTTPQFISNIERGTAKLPISQIDAVAKVFGTSKRQILEALISVNAFNARQKLMALSKEA